MCVGYFNEETISLGSRFFKSLKKDQKLGLGRALGKEENLNLTQAGVLD